MKKMALLALVLVFAVASVYHLAPTLELLPALALRAPCPWPSVSGSDYSLFRASVTRSKGYAARSRRWTYGRVSAESAAATTTRYFTRLEPEAPSGLMNVSSFQESSLRDGEYALLDALGGLHVKPPFNASVYRQRLSRLSAAGGKRGATPSVFILMLDSVSRPQFLREMPLLRRALDSAPGSMARFSFRRVHAFGGGSAGNKIPLHTGQPYGNFTASGTGRVGPRGRLSDSYAHWSYTEAAQRGYLTFHAHGSQVPWGCYHDVRSSVYRAEEHPSFRIDKYMPGRFVYDHRFPRSAFCIHSKARKELLASGSEQPCCMLGVNRSVSLDPDSCLIEEQPATGCSGASWGSLQVLDWTLALMRRYSPLPVFGQVTLWEAHEHGMIGAAQMDSALSAWISGELQPGRPLADCVLLLMSDHGSTDPTYVASAEGALELRMPFLEMLVPRGVLRGHPGAEAALRHNEGVLATSADIYHTLMELIASTPPVGSSSPPPAYTRPSGSLGSSLLHPLQPARTCGDAGVPPEVCVCARRFSGEPVPLHSPVVANLTRRAQEFLDESLGAAVRQGVCQRPRITRVTSAQRRFLVLRWKDAFYEWHLEFETEPPMRFRMQMFLVAEKLAETLAMGGVARQTAFRAQLAPCRRQAEALGINLHLCYCNASSAVADAMMAAS